MARYRYVVDEEALLTLLAIEDQAIARLLPHIEAIAELPSTCADFHNEDIHNCRIANRLAGDFLIAY